MPQDSLPKINPTQETAKITAFISQIFTQTSKPTAIIAVSGGVDSALSLALAAKALGPNQVIGLHLPAKTTPAKHTQLAALAMDTTRLSPAHRLTMPISSILQKTWRIIKHYENTPGDTDMIANNARSFTPLGSRARHLRMPNRLPDAQTNRLRLANLTARIRMMILFDQAKKHNALVVGTENLSEHTLGYYTRSGDDTSDLEPLRHLYKTQVIELAKYLHLSEEIIRQPPTAALWPGQTDANELGFTYPEADPILHLINTHQPLPDNDLARAIETTVKKNTFKQQVPYLL